jgi:putative transposase
VNASPHNTWHGIQLAQGHPGPATCYATLRLSGSLPAHILHELMEHRQACRQLLAQIAERPDRDAVFAEEELSCLEEFDRHLSKHHTGPDWLQEEHVAALVVDALRKKDGNVYDLLAYCIMPNHVHCVIDTGRFQDCESRALKALSAVKRQTSHEANAYLHRSGTFWEHDQLNFTVRTSASFLRILWDVMTDPVRSELCPAWHEWPWTYCRQGIVSTTV